jgi:FkbM family methyltransferase
VLLSYAQNLEDYHLDQVFHDTAVGTYVDVGGGHPVADNVTFHLYLKGWRGLVVEPQERLAAAYAGIRPRDAVHSCLAGRADGEIDFHLVEGMHGLSSAVLANAEGAGQYGAGFTTVRKRVRRLSGLIEEAGLAAIDVLKIDVEGAEPDVLAGLELARHRPRVILVEAVNPINPEAAVAAWEPMLTSQGYAFVFFDNLNRFYVASEHAGLARRFPASPAPWDRVAHLWDCGRAGERSDHPDRRLAETLMAGLFAELPAFAARDPALLARLLAAGIAAASKPGTHGTELTPALAGALLGKAEQPRPLAAPQPDVAALIATDAFRAALGRIACMYDGGHLLE